ncbi:MAG TPA: N,N-dimethylformamidase beta subunit family domain-containing protein [Solirubrobacteraceae bacterium]|nr:N,N-dimethylformamidase beta subunit family domain-containing protein [Solirubrobacteraceae bacterium]
MLVLVPLLFALAPAAAANPIQRENARPGDSGWDIPSSAGTVISGFASETSVAPGESFHLHVSAPAGSRYRVLVYRLGWYHGAGGRLALCLPSCAASRVAVAQPPPTRPDARTGLIVAPWRVTDRVPIPANAVSGYYEAKLQILEGTGTGEVGSVPLIVREQSPRAAVLVQVPVNTWQAYNAWGGKSLYDRPGSTHASNVSFDRPYDQHEFHDMGTDLELPWVQSLERHGVDLAYQTDVDTDRDPGSLLAHRLVFSIGHDEYWTQAMRDAFDSARSDSTNLMFGSNSELWRVRYAAGRHTLIEWRNPNADPIHDHRFATGFFRAFGEPECRLMAVQYEEFAQRPLTAPPTPYSVSGPASDPWLSAAGLKPGDVIDGVMGYEWDSLTPGCFHGQVVSLMHAVHAGSDGVDRSADMVRATSPSGSRAFAMGTMELGWVLDSGLGLGTPNARVQAFVKAALADLTRPAPPARLIARRSGGRLLVFARLRAADPRILRVSVRRLGAAGGCADALRSTCRLPIPAGRASYAGVAVDRWGRSQPLVVRLG